MNDDAAPSEQLVHQRLRNRIMEALEILADGDEAVVRELPTEYFMSFYDWVPHQRDAKWQPNRAMTSEEQTALIEVSCLVDAACDATRDAETAQQLIASGWPKRIQPHAKRALSLMRERGYLSEEQEEAEPER